MKRHSLNASGGSWRTGRRILTPMLWASTIGTLALAGCAKNASTEWAQTAPTISAEPQERNQQADASTPRLGG